MKNFLLQNRQLIFSAKIPYDLVAERSEATKKSLTFPYWLALADDFRTLRWEEVFKYPEVALGQIRKLVGRC